MAEPAPITSYIKVFVLTMAQAYPFLLAVHSFASLDPGSPEDFLPCTQQHPCSYVRFFSSAGMNQSLHVAKVPAADLDTWRQDVCEDPETRKQILNPMPNSISTMVYVLAILFWSALKMIHDWLLLAGYPETTSLTVGWLSHLSQCVAACSGFLLASGAVEVFTIDDASKACYYQIPDFPAMLSLVTPFLLFVMGTFKKRALFFSAINGDFLYAQRYDVPFHFVSQSPGWIGGDLLVPLVTGSREGTERKLSTEFYSSWINKRAITRHVDSLLGLPIGFSTYPMFVRYFRILGQFLRNTHYKSVVMQASITVLMLLPFGVGYVDAALRAAGAFRVARERTVKKIFLLVDGSLLSVNTFCLILVTWRAGREFLTSWSYRSSTDSLKVGSASLAGASIVFMLQYFPGGILDKATAREDVWAILRCRCGNHINVIRDPQSGRHQDECVGFLNDPWSVLAFAKARPTFVQMYFTKEVQVAKEFLQQHVSYDRGNDSEGLWQQMLYKDWQANVTPSMNEYEMLTQSQ